VGGLVPTRSHPWRSVEILLTLLTDFRTNRPSDVISTLVSIYDSKDLFVKELQVLLAQRLLAIQDGNFDSEVCPPPRRYYPSLDTHHLPSQRRNIEILKIRFGEAPLQVCEVMLKDMTDSKRTDQHVQSQKSVRLLLFTVWTRTDASSRCYTPR
jgi:anaphase-promoting complex subunit 2